jgi:antitoxin (DNA-binding transcriptional repressor) of toxin-antitoxin stability system
MEWRHTIVHQIDLEEAKSQLPALLEEAIGGMEVIFTKDDRPVVKLTPIPRTKPRRKFGSAKGPIWMSDDFDEPLKDLEPYMR